MKTQTKPLHTTNIHSISDLAPYLDAWHELSVGAPMQSPEWLLAWWEIYAEPDDKLYILLFHHETTDDLVGLAPLYLQDVRGKAIFRLLGSANDCTHHTTWLSKPGWETQVGIEVAKFLLQYKSGWKRLLFEAVDADATAIHVTINHLAENGCLYNKRKINSVWKIALPKTWDDYLMMLSRSLRKRCRKLQRDFLDSGKIQIHFIDNEADLQKGFEILLHLHGTRWGNTKKPLGVFDDQRFRKFHETTAARLLRRNQLRLAWLEYDGKPLAAEYQFFDSRSVYAYQAGVDLSMKAYFPGRLSMMAAIQFAIARGCEYFDLLRGDDPYKKNWRATPAACHDLRAWQNNGVGRLEWLKWQSYTLAVRYLKPIIPDPLITWGLKLFKG
ncbi:GNAT family N-acetyltransferase [Thermodesulfobacteriota bacterium]